MMYLFGRYPWGLHGYHRSGSLLPSASRELQTNKLIQPLNAIASPKLRQAGVDPLNIYGGNTPKPPEDPVLPPVEQPTTMPEIGDKQTAAARRRALEDQLARRGRASTVLTNDSDKLGG